MFRRKEEMEGTTMAANDMFEGQENSEKATAETGSAETLKEVAQAPVQSAPTQPAPMQATAPAARPAAPAFRPQAAPANLAPAARPATPAPAASAPSTPAGKRILTVGHEINMKGEITSCDRLLIEGSVDATISDVHTVELAQTGSFKGTAEVEDAEISGDFDGELTVRGRLIIYSTGTVRGNVTYGEIEIERGGKLSGSINQIAEAQGAQAAKKKAA